MAHPNAEVVQSLFEAFRTGDGEAIDRILSDSIVFHMPGRGSVGGTFRGKEEVLGSFERMGSAAESFEADVHAVLADDEHAVALISETGERDGTRYEWREVDVFHIEGGVITEMWVLIDDLYSADEFFR